jgi:hypothetical protein
MEKTLEIHLKEHREELAKLFERSAIEEIKSNLHSPNDCAILAKNMFYTADFLRNYK